MILREKQWNDEQLGPILIRENTRCKSIIIRIKREGVVISIPPFFTIKQGEDALERFREKLKGGIDKQKKRMWNEETELVTLTFRLHLFKMPRSNFYTSLKEGILHVAVPADSVLEDVSTQQLIQKQIEKTMRYEAKRVFPERLKELASKYGFIYNDVRINSSKGRWGSCSSSGNINFSFFLLLLPSYLVDFVMLHELCHTVEMNHGERFWNLLNRVTDGMAHIYTKDLKNFQTW